MSLGQPRAAGLRALCTAAAAGLALLASAAQAAPTPLLGDTTPAILQPVTPPPRPPVDPARLKLANELVDLLTPPGTMRAVLEAASAQMMDGFRQQMALAPLRVAMIAAGVAEGDQRRFSPAVFRRLTEILDPAFEARQRIFAEAMFKARTAMMEELEPKLRAGSAEAYARRLSVAELDAVLAFLRTPEGRAFAPLPAMIGSDPAVTERQRAMGPALEKTMPAALASVRDATRKLPPPRRFADLTETEKAEMLRLINAPASVRSPQSPAPVAPGAVTPPPVTPPPVNSKPAKRAGRSLGMS
jgi:hypothetical protein